MSRSHLLQELGDLLWIALGAVPGAVLRWHWSAGWAGTLAANLVACGLLGALVPLQQQRPRLLLLLGVGFCGSLSTFSTWMLELVEAIQGQQPQQALLVLLANLFGGLAAVAGGSGVSRSWLARAERRRERRRHQRSTG